MSELVQMVWMAQPPIMPGGRSRVRKIPANHYWYMAHRFESHADAFGWAYWKAYEDRTAEERAWVARFLDYTELWTQGAP